MLATKVKASSVKHLTDARYFAAWETEWLGFQFSELPGEGVEPAQLLAIREWVDGVQICGEFADIDAETLLAQIDFLHLDSVQVSTQTEAGVVSQVAGRCPVIVEVPVEGYSTSSDISDILKQYDAATYFLLNLTQGGITWSDLEGGYPFGIEQLKAWAQAYSLLLEIDGGALGPAAIMEQLGKVGFSVRGGAEEKVGYKSFDELDDFFEDIEVQI